MVLKRLPIVEDDCPGRQLFAWHKVGASLWRLGSQVLRGVASLSSQYVKRKEGSALSLDTVNQVEKECCRDLYQAPIAAVKLKTGGD